MDTKVTDFSTINIKLASPEKILSWSYGEVTKPETINYRTQRSERNGLFDERIFGPERDYECYCGKYRRIRFKGIICEKCGVEVTKSIVRRDRMGHISLAAPVAHIWFLRGLPSRIGLILDLSVSELEKVIYFAGYVITKTDEAERVRILQRIDSEFKSKSKLVTNKEEKDNLKEAFSGAKAEVSSIQPHRVFNEVEYHKLSLKYGELFEAGIGAEAFYDIFKKLDLAELRKKLEMQIEKTTTQEKIKLLARLNLVKSMERSGVRPEWMFMTVVPVIPPGLRPMVALDGGRHATSDINDLYRRVINRNNRLKKLVEVKAPEVICRNEKRILQEAVDALIDNSMRYGAAAMSQAQKRPLRSLADMLRGKQGRFRQNLLGKRVDYSARSVIVVGPDLKLSQCGLPKDMALELFRPFVISKIIKAGMAFNTRGAGRLIEKKTPEVWAILEEVIEGKHVLLNRAPTLHRLGIQAFQPILIEGKAIQLHPLVCSAFNADFDGDQMAVHLPLGEEAQREAREIMASTKNLLKPGSGDPVVSPSQDMVIGCYWLTKVKEGAKGEGKYFSTPNEAITVYDFGDIDLRAKIKVMGTDKIKYKNIGTLIFETTVGRLLFNNILPDDFTYLNEEMSKKMLSKTVAQIIEQYGTDAAPEVLDKIKKFGFQYATKAGISWGLNDTIVPKEKPEIIEEARKKAIEIDKQHKDGLLTEEERYRSIIEIWQKAKDNVCDLLPKTLENAGSPVFNIVTSGARGNWNQIGQMAGMKGLMVNPAGKIIDFPVIPSYKEGLSVLEYFITTHGARKGEADTALKTSKAGYLTRRLVDVAQDIIVQKDDCGDDKGVRINKKEIEAYGKKIATRVSGRVLARDVKGADGKVLFKKNHLLNAADARAVEGAGTEELFIRSPISCGEPRGICQMCYGHDMGNNKLVKMGEAVGIVAAQAIGEPGTQLTMRTFHTGGIAAGSDITMGLPRVEEIFELRMPKVPAVLSDVDGEVMEVVTKGTEKSVVVLTDDPKSSKTEKKEYAIPFSRLITVKKGDQVKKGTFLTDGAADIKHLFSVAGREIAQNYILSEVDKVYSMQGAVINDKHIEVIVKQMFSRVKIKDEGETRFSKGKVVESFELLDENEKAKEEGKQEASASPMVMPISKVSLSSSSFLAAASFQDTARVLIRSAIEGREDKLRGLKENVIIGRLIPAGTGYRGDFAAVEELESLDEEVADEE